MIVDLLNLYYRLPTASMNCLQIAGLCFCCQYYWQLDCLHTMFGFDCYARHDLFLLCAGAHLDWISGLEHNWLSLCKRVYGLCMYLWFCMHFFEMKNLLYFCGNNANTSIMVTNTCNCMQGRQFIAFLNATNNLQYSFKQYHGVCPQFCCASHQFM